jgi:protein-disulfide isomerase
MPSGKRSKEQRRVAAPPPVQSKGAARARQASPRVLAVAGGAIALIVLVVVLVVVLTGGSSSTKVPTGIPNIGSPTSSVALPNAVEANAIFAGITQKSLTLGSGFAPVTLVEYIDLQCPFCQQFETQVMPDIVKAYVKTGKLKVETRIVGFIGPDSKTGRNAAIAAGFQNKAYPFMELLYYNQGTENTGWLNDNMIATAAASVKGMNVPKLLKDMKSSAASKIASQFDAQMASDKVNSTPTLFVGKSGKKGKLVGMTSSTDKQTLVTAIETALTG